MQLQRLLVLKRLHRRITPRLGQGDLHRLVEEIEPVDLLDGLARGLRVVVNDKCLALCLQMSLGHYVDDISEL